MKQKMKPFFSALCIALFLISTLGSCQKENADGRLPRPNYDKAPHEPVPEEMVGDWSYTLVSSTNVVDQYGHSVPAYMDGITYHIEANGTGWQVHTNTVNTTTYSNKEDLNIDCTYVIEKNEDGSYTFSFYPIQGTVYDNDHFSHVLDESKCYPAFWARSNINLGEYNGKTLFEVEGSGEWFYKK